MHTQTNPADDQGVMQQDDAQALRLIRRLNQHANKVVADAIRKVDSSLTLQQFHALQVVHLHDGITQAQVAAKMSCDRPTTGKILERLEAAGCILSRRSESDARAINYSITNDGLERFTSAQPVFEQVQSSVFAHLSSSQTDQLVSLLSKAVCDGQNSAPNP